MMRSAGSMIRRRNWLPPILNVRFSNKIWSCASTYSHHQRVYILPVHVDATSPLTPPPQLELMEDLGTLNLSSHRTPHPLSRRIGTSHCGLWAWNGVWKLLHVSRTAVSRLLNCGEIEQVLYSMNTKLNTSSSIGSWYICRGTYGLHARCPHHFSFKYNTRSLWQPHKLSLPATPITDRGLGLCKWQPPQPPFASALVTDWSQCHRCPPRMHVVPLYKRAHPPSPFSLFGWMWLRSHRNPEQTPHLDTRQTVGLLSNLLVDFSFCWRLTTVDPIASRSLATECEP